MIGITEKNLEELSKKGFSYVESDGDTELIEVVGRRKTLWDKKFHKGGTSGWEEVYYHFDVKDALEEFLGIVEDSGRHIDLPRVYDEAKLIFGEKLIK